jgi:hypothetical protein
VWRVGEVGLDGGAAGAETGVDRIAVDTDDDGSFFGKQARGGFPDT